MEIELWALDTKHAEAVVRYAGHWYRLRRDRAWWPEDLGNRQPTWTSEPGFIQIRKLYSRFDALVADLKSLLEAGVETAFSVRSRLRSSMEPETDAREGWAQDLPYLIHLYQGALDQIFALRGCTPQASFTLVLETFRRLFLLGPLDGQEVEDRLPALAADVYREIYGDRAHEPQRRGRHPLLPVLDDPDLEKALADLDRPTLRCLSLWADPRLNEAELALILQVPEEEVRLRLDLAAAKLGRSRADLKSPQWVASFVRAFRRHLD